MRLTLAAGDIVKQSCDLLLLPVFESDLGGGKPPMMKALAALNEALSGLPLRAAGEEDFTGKAEQSLLFHTFQGAGAKRALLLGLGPRQRFQTEVLRLALGRGMRAAQRVSAKSLAVALPEAREEESCVKAAAEGLLLGAYKFDRYKSAPQSPAARAQVAEARLVLPAGVEKTRAMQEALDLAGAVARATNWARDLVNEPANALTPSRLAGAARQVAREGKLEVQVLARPAIERLKMGLFLGVSHGSAEPPALVHLAWVPPGKAARSPAVALVGKAITYDSGGLSLKPTESMVDMKTDMAGAAAVLGAMKVVAELKPPFPVHAFMGACENMPGSRAYKPGDILTSRLGKTVEITNTDAEGRLVLADVLAWANERKPALLVDLATLTGACMVALGHHIAGAFGSEDTAVWEVLEAAKSSGEEVWRLPLSEHQRDNLKSEVADLKNTGERWGGALNAALFLKEFVGETPWVHLDIAGPSTSPKERGYLAKGATGFGVRTLVELVRARMRQGA